MNQKEEKKQIMLNLCLPFIEIDANDAWNKDHYKESGLFYVKTKDGNYRLVDVDEGKSANECCLFPSVCNILTEKMATLSVRDEMRSMITSLAEAMREEFATSRKEMQSSFLEVEQWLNEDKDGLIEKLETFIEMLKQSKAEETPKISQGFISESALVDILRTIK